MDYFKRFERTLSLVGREGLAKLRDSRIAVFGLGGVGSYTAEALARSGTGTLILIDKDTVDITNCNRQLCALDSTIGKFKTEVMKKRLIDINPEIQIEIFNIFFLPGTESGIKDKIFSGCNYIADAVDTVSAKLEIAKESKKRNIPLVSAMGCGNKFDGTAFKIADISKTSVCPLAKVMRRELKKAGITDYNVVYSTEPPSKPLDENGENTKKSPGSLPWVTGTAGLIMAGKIVRDITGS